MGQHQEELARLQVEILKKKAAEDAEAKRTNDAISKGCFSFLIIVFLLMVFLFIFGK